jgi:hypothetical protein
MTVIGIYGDFVLSYSDGCIPQSDLKLMIKLLQSNMWLDCILLRNLFNNKIIVSTYILLSSCNDIKSTYIVIADEFLSAIQKDYKMQNNNGQKSDQSNAKTDEQKKSAGQSDQPNNNAKPIGSNKAE